MLTTLHPLLRLFSAALIPLHRLSGGRRSRFEAAGASVPVWEFGPADGEPWLLLHGLASTALAWRPVIKALRHECRLVVPELSAWAGARTLTDGGGGIGLEQGRLLVHGLLERFPAGRPATVAGMSLGAWMALLAAFAGDPRIGRLVLVDAAGYRDQDWQRIERLVRARTRDDFDELCTALFARPPWFITAARPGLALGYRSSGVAGTLGSIQEEHSFGAAELARLRLPAAVIWGEEDRLFELRVGEEMAAALPAGCLYRLPGCGHNPQWEAPRALVEAVRHFRGSTAPGWAPAASV
jgi:pimeloyl-ACP methyl ester carboxylesterase